MRRFTTLLLVLLMISVYALAAQEATDSYAAVLRINAATVEVQRAGTERWLPLPATAEFAFGDGDSVRTDRYGRAWLNFAQVITLRALVMSESEARIGVYSDSQVVVTLVSGRMAFTLDTTPTIFQVIAGGAVIDTIAGNFAVQVTGETIYVVASTGVINVHANGVNIPLSAGYGVRVGATNSNLVELGERANFARIDGILDGCPGDIQARGEDALNVRVGPALSFDALGSIPNGTPVFLMAMNPRQERYRIQFLSGFGWVLANGVVNRCANLPELPVSAVEQIVRILDPTAEELDILRPYFGEPDDDAIFYSILTGD